MRTLSAGPISHRVRWAGVLAIAVTLAATGCAPQYADAARRYAEALRAQPGVHDVDIATRVENAFEVGGGMTVWLDPDVDADDLSRLRDVACRIDVGGDVDVTLAYRSDSGATFAARALDPCWEGVEGFARVFPALVPFAYDVVAVEWTVVGVVSENATEISVVPSDAAYDLGTAQAARLGSAIAGALDDSVYTIDVAGVRIEERDRAALVRDFDMTADLAARYPVDRVSLDYRGLSVGLAGAPADVRADLAAYTAATYPSAGPPTVDSDAEEPRPGVAGAETTRAVDLLGAAGLIIRATATRWGLHVETASTEANPAIARLLEQSGVRGVRISYSTTLPSGTRLVFDPGTHGEPYSERQLHDLGSIADALEPSAQLVSMIHSPGSLDITFGDRRRDDFHAAGALIDSLFVRGDYDEYADGISINDHVFEPAW